MMVRSTMRICGPLLNFAVEQLGDVGEADVLTLQFLLGQHADAAIPFDTVPFEGEVDFLDAVTFGLAAEFRFGTLGAAAKEGKKSSLGHGDSLMVRWGRPLAGNVPWATPMYNRDRPSSTDAARRSDNIRKGEDIRQRRPPPSGRCKKGKAGRNSGGR